MSIKTKIIILAIFSLVVTTTIGLILFQDSLTVKKEIEKQRIISEVRNKMFERIVLQNEYFLYREERPIVQLQLESEVLEKILIQASSIETSADKQVLISRLGDNTKFIDQTLSQIVVNFKTEISSPSASAHELEQRLISQILIKSQENIAISSQLSEASRNKITESQQKAIFFILVSVVGIILIIIFALYFIWLSMAKPLIALKESALRIASLDFSSTTTGSNDEIGQLARAFNTMVVKLKESAAGKEDARSKLVITAKELAVIAKEKEDVRRKLVVTTDKLIRTEKLATLGKLAGIIGHEIRNPLGVIRNSIYFLTMKFKGSMDEKVKRHLDILQTEIDGADKIISDVLEFARTRPPSFTQADINSVVKTALSKASIPKTVKVQTDLGENLPKINIDRIQIGQVFLNMISNAIEAMPKGGELRVSTKKTDTSISIALTDTGAGIQKENISKIFEPLFSTKAKGLGLGLVACQNIISAHQGKIEFESKENQGTTFVIKLPIAQKVDTGQEKLKKEIKI